MYKAATGGVRALWLPHHRLPDQRAQSLETLYAAQRAPPELGPPASAACTAANILSILQRLLTTTLCCRGQPALLASIQIKGSQEEDCAACRGSARQGLSASLPLLPTCHQAGEWRAGAPSGDLLQLGRRFGTARLFDDEHRFGPLVLPHNVRPPLQLQRSFVGPHLQHQEQPCPGTATGTCLQSVWSGWPQQPGNGLAAALSAAAQGFSSVIWPARALAGHTQCRRTLARMCSWHRLKCQARCMYQGLGPIQNIATNLPLLHPAPGLPPLRCRRMP